MKMFFIASVILLSVLFKTEAHVVECKRVDSLQIICQDAIASNDTVRNVINKTSIDYFNEKTFESGSKTIQELINKNI